MEKSVLAFNTMDYRDFEIVRVQSCSNLSPRVLVFFTDIFVIIRQMEQYGESFFGSSEPTLKIPDDIVGLDMLIDCSFQV